MKRCPQLVIIAEWLYEVALAMADGSYYREPLVVEPPVPLVEDVAHWE